VKVKLEKPVTAQCGRISASVPAPPIHEIVQVSMWHGGGMHSTECYLVLLLLLPGVADVNVVSITSLERVFVALLTVCDADSLHITNAITTVKLLKI